MEDKNIFSILPQDSSDTIIENNNQLRNARKKLNKLKGKNGDPEEIKKINVLINEYINKDIYIKKNNNKIKNLFDENDFLNNEVRKINIIKKKLLEEKGRFRWREKQNKNNPRKWKYKSHSSYPISFRFTIVTIFCINNRPGNLLNLLPKEILIYTLENNISWFSFPPIPNEKIIFRNYK
tara:strand:- start:886 stop:1425 length:540 start_codon:yes stop_codon:yes gene_type:complete